MTFQQSSLNLEKCCFAALKENKCSNLPIETSKQGVQINSKLTGKVQEYDFFLSIIQVSLLLLLLTAVKKWFEDFKHDFLDYIFKSISPVEMEVKTQGVEHCIDT